MVSCAGGEVCSPERARAAAGPPRARRGTTRGGPVSTQVLGSLTLALLLLLAGANLLGQLAARLRQPKVVGEILAGIVLGPSLLGLLAPRVSGELFGTGQQDPPTVVLGFLYHLGLLLLMFV